MAGKLSAIVRGAIVRGVIVRERKYGSDTVFEESLPFAGLFDTRRRVIIFWYYADLPTFQKVGKSWDLTTTMKYSL